MFKMNYLQSVCYKRETKCFKIHICCTKKQDNMEIYAIFRSHSGETEMKPSTAP